MECISSFWAQSSTAGGVLTVRPNAEKIDDEPPQQPSSYEVHVHVFLESSDALPKTDRKYAATCKSSHELSRD
jgi:hypothetical protein